MKRATVVAVAAFASQALAKPEPMPYKPVKAFISTREIFGLNRRDTDGYSPYQSICGAGTTCAQACGDAYNQCASSDNQMHCYNVEANESCCPDGTGNSCDEGYYCSVDSTSQTWCCPEGMDLDTCASKYQVTGSLHTTSVVLTTSTTSSTSARSTSVASSTTSSVASSTTTSASTHAATHVASHATPQATSPATSQATSQATSHVATSSALVGGVFFDTGNSTAGAVSATGAYGASATSKVSTSASGSAASGSASTTGSSTTSGASSSGPAAFLALLGAAAFIAFV